MDTHGDDWGSRDLKIILRITIFLWRLIGELDIHIGKDGFLRVCHVSWGLIHAQLSWKVLDFRILVLSYIISIHLL